MFVVIVEKMQSDFVLESNAYKSNDALRLCSYMLYHYYSEFNEPVLSAETLIKEFSKLNIDAEYTAEFFLVGYKFLLYTKPGWLTEEQDSTMN